MDLITPDFGLIFWQTVILLAALFILGKFAWGPILKTIQEREERIEAALEAAEEAKKLVAQVKDSQETLLKETDIERERIIKEALATKNSIIKEAEEVAQKAGKEIIKQARVVLNDEREAAIAVLKNEVAALSIQMAEKVIQRELKEPKAQEKLVQQLAQDSF